MKAVLILLLGLAACSQGVPRFSEGDFVNLSLNADRGQVMEVHCNEQCTYRVRVPNGNAYWFREFEIRAAE